MAYLLDTNSVSELIRNPRGLVSARMAQVGERRVFISIIVASELRYGAAKRTAPVLEKKISDLLSRFVVIPFESPADQFYGALRAQLESKGTPISANDMLIAAHALALGYALVTDNEREFSRIEGLSIENWLR